MTSLTGENGVRIQGTLTDPLSNYGWNFGSTITTSPYTVVQGDGGTVKRFNNNTTPFDVTLPLLTYPFQVILFNDGNAPVNVTLPAGDFNGST